MKILEHIPSNEFVEEEHSFTLKVFVLGMKKNQINVQIDGHYLWISTKQIGANEFQKTYLLPDHIRVDSVQAIWHNGFLTIHLEKGVFEGNPNLIKVKVKGQSKYKASLIRVWKNLKGIVQTKFNRMLLSILLLFP